MGGDFDENPSNPCPPVFHHQAVDYFTNQCNQIQNTDPYLSIDCEAPPQHLAARKRAYQSSPPLWEIGADIFIILT